MSFSSETLKHSNAWIIRVGNWYLKHPRGEWTKLAKEAYGYHYKLSGAEIEATNWRSFLSKLFSLKGSSAPGMLPEGGFKTTDIVQVSRRKEALQNLVC